MKPIQAKPSLYAHLFFDMKEIARDHGYNLLLHGSMKRDLDLVAVPWVNDPKPEMDLINALSEKLTGKTFQTPEHYKMSLQPGGRHAYIIDLNRGGYKRTEDGDIADPIEFTPDPEYYVDISVTPIVNDGSL